MKLKNIIIAFALSLTAGAAGVGALASVRANQNANLNQVRAYSQDDTTWYLTGEFNNWNKADPRYHLSYSGKSGNNWQFDSDFAVKLHKGEKFNIVYSWNDGAGWNTFCPNLQGDAATDFTNPSGKDYFTANDDWIGRFFFQVYGEGASWIGLYSYEYTDESEYEDDFKMCLNAWAYDFIDITGDICDGDDTDNESDLQDVWNDSTVTSTTSSWCVAGDFTDWATNKIPMHVSTTANTCVLTDVFIIEAYGFKVTNGTDWYPGSNQYPASTGYYTITFNTSTHAVSYTKQDRQYLKSSFEELFDDAQSQFTSSNTWTETANAYERYAHIINRYSSLDNFASGTVSRSSQISILNINNNQEISLVITIIVSLSALTVASYFFLRKKKEN